MPFELDHWAVLDSAKALRDIERQTGKIMFNQWSYTDTALCSRQMQAVLGVTLTKDAMLDPSRAAYEIETAVNASEGGNSAPAWVPANARIHIDFLGGTPQGRAWSNGAVVAIDTLLGSDPNTENAWGPTGYDPADLTADGLKYSTSPPALIGAALTKVLAGATVRFVVKVGLPLITSSFVLVSSDGADAIDIDDIDIDMHAYSWNGTANADLNGILNNLNGAINATAVTVTATRLEAVANGYTTPIALTLSDADRPVANPLTAAIMDAFSQILQSITIYDPLPTTAGLSALSAV